MRKYRALSNRAMGRLPFRVSGGPFTEDQMMGWQIVDEDTGRTAAASNDAEFCERLNALEVVARMLERYDLYHFIANDLHDTGLWEIPDPEWDAFKEAVRELQGKKKRQHDLVRDV